MLLTYTSLSKKPRIFKKLTGVSLEEFHVLCEKTKPDYQKVFKSVGRPSVLRSIEDKLTILMVYYRTYVTHEFLGYFVGLDNSNICRLFKKMEPLLARKIYIKKDRTLTNEKIEEILLDVTEQPIQRPKKTSDRKKYYSGKKKRHTQKVELVMTPEGEILSISHTRPGSEHDFKVRRQSDPLPRKPKKYVDLGYQGLQKITRNTFLPFKKPKGKPLNSEQKSYNKAHSRIRIAIEHKFSEVKKFRILGEVYRNFRKKHHLRFNIIAGILNMQNGF